PADAAMLADAAAGVVMVHHALANRRLALRDARAARRDDAAGLVSGDEGFGALAQAQRLLRLARRRPVELEVRAAHARSLHLDHDFAGTRRRIREVADFDLPIAEKHR